MSHSVALPLRTFVQQDATTTNTLHPSTGSDAATISSDAPRDVEMTPMDSTHVAASLPALDDYAVLTHKPSSRRRFCWMMGVVLLIVVAIGVSVGVGVTTTRNDRSSSQPTNTNTNGGTTNTNSNTNTNTNLANPGESFTETELHTWLVKHAAVASTAALHTRGTPQELAAAWLANTDRFITELPTTKDDAASYVLVARYALVVLYYTWAGTTWESSMSFLDPTKSVCEWNGVGIGFNDAISDVEGEFNGVFCQDDTELPVALDLELNNLHGPIPPELGLLTTLKAIDLEYNTIQGTIPTEICWLTDLQHLWVQSNQLEGRLPDCLGAQQPNMLGLHLQDNPGLTGNLPTHFCAMTQMQTMVLDRCGFTGPIPSCIGDNWKDAQILSFSDNMFTGQLPASFGGLAELRELYIDGNTLEGNPLPIVTQLANLDMLYIEENFFTGQIDTAFATSLAPTVRALDMSENQFTLASNTFPTALFDLPNLTILDLSKNQLAGSMPDSIPIQNNIVFFSVHQNRLTGVVPASLANLNTLHHLDLSNNDFGGAMPTAFFLQPVLYQIFLAENPGLTAGPVPTLSSTLRELSLKNTNRNGPLPNLINFNDLHILDLDDNGLTGTIPAHYGQLLELRHLLLNSNPALSGTLPAFTTTYNLGTVLLDKTGVTGDFNSICNLPSFQGIAFIDTEVVMIADCANADSAIQCDCCHCCLREQALCSDPQVASLDWTWESGFVRYARDFALNHTRLERPMLTP